MSPNLSEDVLQTLMDAQCHTAAFPPILSCHDDVMLPLRSACAGVAEDVAGAEQRGHAREEHEVGQHRHSLHNPHSSLYHCKENTEVSQQTGSLHQQQSLNHCLCITSCGCNCIMHLVNAAIFLI